MYTRIDRAKAKKLIKQGLHVALCASNMRPGDPWYPEIEINRYSVNNYNGIDFESKFKNLVNHFMYYNCNKETGNKVSYFLSY